MRQDFFEFRPTHKLILCTNDRPRIPGGGHGIWRRVALVPFGVRFWKPELKESGPAHLRADPALPGRLAAELPGVLAWMVRGCLEWQAGGLAPPEEVKAATGQYREQQNTIGGFLGERCERIDGVQTLFRDLYAAYCQWAAESHETPLGKIRFNDAVEKENLARGRITATNLDVWKGLALRPTAGRPVATLADLDE